jgi:hypothetical protein
VLVTRVVVSAVVPRGGRVFHVKAVSDQVVFATGWMASGTSPVELRPPCSRNTARPTVAVPTVNRTNAWRWLSTAAECFAWSAVDVPKFCAA